MGLDAKRTLCVQLLIFLIIAPFKFTHWNMNKNKPNLRKFLRTRTGEKMGGVSWEERGGGAVEGGRGVTNSYFEPLKKKEEKISPDGFVQAVGLLI